MRILFLTASPFCATGYGQQGALLAPRLAAAGHDVAILATAGHSGAPAEWNGIPLFGSDGKVGLLTLDAYAAYWEADLVLSLVDVFPLATERFSRLPLASWVPVDHAPLPPNVKAFFTKTGARPVAMARFGERMLQDAGLDPLYVPHAVETGTFTPRDRAESRARLGLPDDAFVVGMVAANIGNAPPRKAFPQAFQAFAAFHAVRPDSVLYVHAESTGLGLGVNLEALAGVFGLPPGVVRFADQFRIACVPLSGDEMAETYSAMDVLLNASYGEGFGVPIVESQACGTPVIVSNWSAMPELCGAGWAVGGEPWYDVSQGSCYLNPSVMEITGALLAAAEHAAGMRDQAREFALAYDADKVFEEMWLPVLDELERTLRHPAAGPNRAQRRAAAKRKRVAA